MTTSLATYELTIVDGVHPGRPPLTMNEFERANRWTRTDAKKRIRWQIKAELKKNPIPPISRVKISITQHAPDARPRDADGLSAYRKAAIDSLVREGVLVDDAQKYVVDGGNTIELDRTNPRMVIRLDVLDAT